MKIGKSYLLIFVMSIISFILFVLSVIGAIAAYAIHEELADIINGEATDVDAFMIFFAIFFVSGSILLLAIAIGAAVVTVILGIFGIICARQNGKFSIGCLIMGGIPTLFTAFEIVQSLLDGDFEPIMFPIFLYFGLYTAGAVLAYIEKRSGENH